ncbi:GNAT family N-acetyltransferase [Sphingomonas immobilis]|uniref:N-acetyltransferase n=1 Tax=Sphingomonas immobilis TaxID=3063997 RepID=A0ABT9A1Q3_9SPHN|nr:N-acetyltransferase [Sphingomonas sp. CA1-15]MDO7842931.1 N-acetyltransferase [Sphingomonas sp. CA1-15]
MIEIVPIAAVSADAVEQLLDRAFGPDRHTRTACRIRQGTQAIPALSFASVEDGALIGTIQCWPVRLARDAGGSAPLVMVGPVAVEPSRQRGGIGQALTAHAIRVADETGADPLMLIGDPEYYGRFFGFDDSATGAWRVPGPVERRRLLARGPAPADAGMLEPRVVATA